MDMISPQTEEAAARARAALVVAHPGHELRVYGWLKQIRPRVFVLTDGSGHSGVSRITRTSEILAKLQAEKGSLFGRFTDKSIYQALLNHDLELFVEIAEELASQFLDNRITIVVGDAREDHNPTHDVCRLVIDAAVAIARKASGSEIQSLEFAIVGSTNGHQSAKPDIQCITLDADCLAEKIVAARGYVELKEEIDHFIKTQPEDSFRCEYLYPATNHAERGPLDGVSCFYEAHGERRVREGLYKDVIRYADHVLPVATRLGELAK